MSGPTTADFDSLVPDTPFSRRGFLVTALGAGFALAVQPVTAQTAIRTDNKSAARAGSGCVRCSRSSCIAMYIPAAA